MKTVGELKQAILKLNPAMKYCPSYVVFYEKHTQTKFKNGFTWNELFKMPDHLSLTEDGQESNGQQGTLIVVPLRKNRLAQVSSLRVEETAKTKNKIIIECELTENDRLNMAVADLLTK